MGCRMTQMRVFLAIAIAVSVAATPSRAGQDETTVYLTLDQAPKSLFPGAQVERKDVPSTPEFKEKLKAKLGRVTPTVWEESYRTFTATQDNKKIGYAVVVDEIGKVNPFTLIVAATPLMLLTVAIDDERRSKEALRVSDERMSLAMQSAQLALCDWDVVNDRVWMTDEGRKFFSFEPDEPLHYESLAGRVHPDDSAVRATAIQQVLESGGSYEAEYRIILPDGAVRWVAARGHRPSPGGNDAPPRIIGVSMDITRQKQADAEAQLQREELAHLSRVATLAAISGSLAHELSQPLGSILNNAQAGQRLAAQDAPDLGELRAIFADIVSADRRAGEIIDRQRTMLRRGEVVLQPVNMNESLEELLRLTRSDLIARGVSVSNLANADLPAAMTDRVQLQQVLLNLIVNACDAMASNPPEERRLTLTTAVAQNEMRIGVLDCGTGLPDDVETLFQPFHTTKDHGLGMGLSICRTLVTSHGGRLWAERRAERGAAFYIALPLAKADA